MKKETFEKKQIAKFEKFLEKGRKVKFNGFLFCKYKQGYLFGDLTHFEYAKVSEIADDLKQYEKDSYINILSTWDRMYTFSAAELTEVETTDNRKLYQLSNVFGDAYINKKFFPIIPDGCVFKTCTHETRKYPVTVSVDGEPVAWILPILYPCIKQFSVYLACFC